MTLEELERQTSDTETLNAVQVATVLGCDPQWLRDQARNGTFPLPFPYFFSGKGRSKKFVVPKRRFLRYMRGEDVDRLHDLLGALIDAAQARPEVLEGWRYTVNGPEQRQDANTPKGKPARAAHPSPENPPGPARGKPAPIDWHKRDKPAQINWNVGAQ